MMDPFYYVLPEYCKPERHYHGINHITRMLKDAHTICNGHVNPQLYFAILFHDVVYNVPRQEKSNEYLSAQDFLEYCVVNPDLNTYFANDVIDMILATEHHFDGTEYDSDKINLMLDLDLMAFTDDFDTFYKTQKTLDAEFLPHYPKTDVIYNRRKFLKDIYDNRTLKFRFVENKDELTAKAYQNIRQLLNFGG